MKIFGAKILGAVALLIVLAGLGVWLAARQASAPLSLAELEARYATPDSRFADIDGIRVHYMDQGQGPAVVLLHASFMNLRTWDSMAAALSDRYRVIRPDLLIAGLTGPDPAGEYSVERNIAIVEGLTRSLGVGQYAIVATSSGGTVGFRLAARYPERVTRLVLINSAGMPRTAATNPNRPKGTALTRWLEVNFPTRERVRDTLAQNFVPPHAPPGWLVDMNHDLWRREGRAEESALQIARFETGDPEAVLAGITVPTLILWGLENRTVMHLEADVFQHWLVNAPTLKKKYPGVGHYVYLEIPAVVEQDVLAFLDGQLDGELRRTQRLALDGTAVPGRAGPAGQ
jgi:pimeloyl-ACP methyl ester carboxylesterase